MSSHNASPVYSSLSNDPDIVNLVEEFVANLQDRIASIQASVDANDVEQLAGWAHQLKGSCGGYGFIAISEAAASLEVAARGADSVEQCMGDINELISLCRRATAEPPPPTV